MAAVAMVPVLAIIALLLWTLGDRGSTTDPDDRADADVGAVPEPSVVDSDGPSVDVIQASFESHSGRGGGKVTRIISTDDDEIYGVEVKIVRFEAQFSDLSVVECGAAFEKDLVDRWLVGQMDCVEIADANLLAFEPPTADELWEVGCADYESTPLYDDLTCEIGTPTISQVDAYPQDMLEVSVDMYRSKWHLNNRSSATCKYLFRFIKHDESADSDQPFGTQVGDWWLIEDGAGEDIFDCVRNARTTLTTAVPAEG